MRSNYNVLYLPMATYGKHEVGDVFTLSDEAKRVCDWRVLKFEGLKIKSVDYTWGVRLRFDWAEWYQNKPAERPKPTATERPLNRNTY